MGPKSQRRADRHRYSPPSPALRLTGGLRFHNTRNVETKEAVAVAAFITSAYWFTSSTSFANPAVTLARAFTERFAGIAPDSVPLFLSSQVLGGFTALVVARWLMARS